MNYSSCRVRRQKSKLSYRYSELREVKVKKKITRNVQAFSLVLLSSLVSGKGKRKLIPPFLFHCNKCWNRLPFLTLGNLPDPWIKSASLTSPALAGRYFTTAPPSKSRQCLPTCKSIFSKMSASLLLS